jgi:hypothetical protein
MRTLLIGTGIDLDFGATAAGDAIDMSAKDFPFQPGGSAIAVLAIQDWAEAESVASVLALQGSDNAFSGWADLAEANHTAGPVVMQEITIPDWLRWANQSATAGDGVGSIYLLQN